MTEARDREPTPTSGDNLLDIVQDMDEMRKNMEISKMEGTQSEAKIRPFYSEIGAKMGAYVICVEPESWETNGKKHNNMAVLGHFIKVVDVSGGHVQVFFTTMDGATFQKGRLRGQWKMKWTEHPLSAKPRGYKVPKKGGLHVCNNGWVVLISRHGLLSGKNAWEYAEWARDMLMREQALSNKLQSEVEDKNAQLQEAEESLMQYEVECNAMRYVLKDMKRALIVAQGATNNLQAVKEALMADIQMLSEIDGYRTTTLMNHMTKAMKAIEDIQAFVSIQKIDESLRANSNEHPKVTDELRKRMADDWAAQGITGPSEAERKADEAMERIQRLEQDKKQREAQQEAEARKPRPRKAREQKPEPIPEPQQEPKGDDDDGSASGSQESQESVGRTEEDDKRDGGAGGDDEPRDSGEDDREGSESSDGTSGIQADEQDNPGARTAFKSLRDKMQG